MAVLTITEVVPIETDDDGVIRVSKTRVTLDRLIAAFKNGATPEEIAQQYSSVPLADIYLIICYYLRQSVDVEAYLTKRAEDDRQIKIENESQFSQMMGMRSLEKWRKWFDTIMLHIQMLYLYRYIFEKVDDIVLKNKSIDKQHLFLGFLANIYVDSVVMGIRRQLKIDKDSVSLKKLLAELTKYPHLVTRSDFYANFFRNIPDNTRQRLQYLAEQRFNQYAGGSFDHINSGLIHADIELLESICKSSETYADKRIAHWDKKGPDAISYDDIYLALDQLGEIAKKYYLLLYGVDMVLQPGLPYPISDIFRKPWIVS